MRFLMAFVILVQFASAQLVNHNKPARQEWFRDLGFGMFIHWSVDVNLGVTISHSLPGASKEYVERYYRELPRLFEPSRFEAKKWARLAKLAGMQYVVLTAKHHSGFCLWDTKTTPFNVMNTPFRRDIVREVLDAFRAEGIAAGIYISPDDFWWFHQNGMPIARPPAKNTTTKELPAMLEHGKRQLKELLTNYGKVDILFIDGPADGLREYAWELDPDIVVTRGAMETPEQTVPEVVLDQPWEACITIGNSWQHKPTNDERKSGTELLKTLIAVRARGGNLLLNVGPTPEGELHPEEEARLREVAAWMFVNGEAIHGTRPWITSREGDTWFTRKAETVYAISSGQPWPHGEFRSVRLRSVKTGPATQIGVVGQSDELLEYRPAVNPKTTWQDGASGLAIRAMRAQRFYDNRRWPNPVVLKISGAQPGLAPPAVTTSSAAWTGTCWRVTGELQAAPGSTVVFFQHRTRKGLADLYQKTEAWKDTAPTARTTPGGFEACLSLPADFDGEFRAVARNELETVFGNPRPLDPKREIRLH